MRRVFCISLLVILCGSLAAQTKNARNRNASRTVFEGQPASVRLAPRVTTTIRLPEPVNSVVLGDSNLSGRILNQRTIVSIRESDRIRHSTDKPGHFDGLRTTVHLASEKHRSLRRSK